VSGATGGLAVTVAYSVVPMGATAESLIRTAVESCEPTRRTESILEGRSRVRNLRQHAVKALGALAVAERDIRALCTTRADSSPLRRLTARAHPALSVRQASG